MKNKIIVAILILFSITLVFFSVKDYKNINKYERMYILKDKDLYHLDPISEKNPDKFHDGFQDLVDELLDKDVPYYTHSSFLQMYKNGMLEPRQTFFSKKMYELVTPNILKGVGLQKYFDFDYNLEEPIPVIVGYNFAPFYELGKTYEDSLFGHIVEIKIVGIIDKDEYYPDLLQNINYFDEGIIYPVNKSLFKKYVDSPQDADMMFNRTLFKNPQDKNLFSDKMTFEENGICDFKWIKIDEKIKNWKGGFLHEKYTIMYVKITFAILTLIIAIYLLLKKLAKTTKPE